MAKSSELITRIKLMGHVDPSVQKAFATAQRQASSSIKNLEKYTNAAKKLAKATSTAIAAAGAVSLKSAIDFESAFAGVKKTVDETDTTKYEDLAQGIRDLSKEMPTAATEIAGVAESAGQLGIKADDILKFSKIMVQLGETTNLSAEEAATSIAKLFNVTGTSMDNVDRFGATIVALGNNAATTEADIMAMASRIAGSGKQIGLTEQQILALSTTLSSVGIEAEMGGSAISTVMTNIDKAVSMNSKVVKDWAKLTGKSASSFRKAWEKDAYGTLLQVVKGMDEARQSGKNLNLILDDLGIKEIRTSDTMKRLSSASGLMADMTDIANKAWEENVALSNEANTRYATMASKLSILKNKLTDAAITIGTHLMPYVDKLINKIDEIDFDKVAEDITNLIDYCIEHKDAIAFMFKSAIVAMGTFKVAGFIKDVKEIVNAFKPVAKMSKDLGKEGKGGLLGNLLGKMPKINFTVPLAGLKSIGSWVGSKLPLAFAKLGSVLASVTPAGWVAIAIAAIAGLFTWMWNKFDWFREFWIDLWEDVKKIGSDAWKWISNFFTETIPKIVDDVVEWFKKIPDKVSKWFNETVDKASLFVGGIVDWFKKIPSKVGGFLSETWDSISEWASDLWSKAKEIGKNFVDELVYRIKNLPYTIGYHIGKVLGTVASWTVKLGIAAYELGKEFVTNAIEWFKQLPSKVWTWLQNTWTKVSTWATNMWDKAVEIGTQFVTSIVEWFQQLPTRIWTWLTNTWIKVSTWASNMWNKAKEIGRNFVNSIVTFFSTLPTRVWTWLQNTWTNVSTWAVNMWNKAIEVGSKFVNSVINFVNTLPSKVWTWLSNTASKVVTWGTDLASKGLAAAQQLVDTIVTKVKELPSKMFEIGKNIVKGIWDGIVSVKDWIGNKISSFCSGIADGFTDFFSIHSPSRLMAKFGSFIGKGLGIGIEKTKNFVGKSVSKVNDVVQSGIAKTVPIVQPIMATAQKIKSKVKKPKKPTPPLPQHGDGGTFTTPHPAIVGDAPETIVPHGNTPRNRALLQEAAKGVGAETTSTQINITFAPVINGGNVEENRKMIQEEEEEFERKMDAYFAKKGRLAF